MNSVFTQVSGHRGSSISGLPLYAPWSLFVWWLTFGDQAPDIFARAGGLAALGGALSASIAIGGGIWRGRAGKHPSTYGSARWASERDIRQSGLYDDGGVILGCLGNRYLRHDGPEHILAVAPTRSGKGVGLVIPTLLTWPRFGGHPRSQRRKLGADGRLAQPGSPIACSSIR